MKLVVLDSKALNPGDLSWDWLKGVVDDFEIFEETAPELVFERSKGTDILVTNKVPITKELIDSLPNLKFIAVLATGFNVIDCAAARKRSIPVSNIPAYSTDSVAQHVFALLLEMTNQVGAHSQSVFAGDWAKSSQFCYQVAPLTELQGKTFGIIGFGKIGSAVAQIANAMNMNVIAYSPNTRTYNGFGKVKFVTLDEVIEKSDVISLHCPLTEETDGLVNASFLSKMKKTAFLINTSRGGVINEKDLRDALDKEKIAGAGVDVLSIEPPKDGNFLIGAKNCFITPHIAWASYDTRNRLMSIFKENVKAFADGKPINVVN